MEKWFVAMKKADFNGIAEKYHITSKPGKAKAIAQHCEEIPDFIVKLRDELDIIEMLG